MLVRQRVRTIEPTLAMRVDVPYSAFIGRSSFDRNHRNVIPLLGITKDSYGRFFRYDLPLGGE